MKIDTVRMVYFSPTGTTKRVLTGIADGMGVADLRHHDLTLDRDGSAAIHTLPGELVIFGVPVYSGRVVRAALPRLKRIQGGKTLAVPVVLYGNRDFEDALLELSDLVRELGFTPLAAAAFIGEHSFSTPNRPIAVGRPDGADLATARDFGARIRALLEKLEEPGGIVRLQVPGNTPYAERDRSHVEQAATRTVEDVCTLCGACEPACPVGAISIGDAVETDTAACILCNACARACPMGARIMDDPAINRVADWVFERCQERRQPQIYWAGGQARGLV